MFFKRIILFLLIITNIPAVSASAAEPLSIETEKKEIAQVTDIELQTFETSYPELYKVMYHYAEVFALAFIHEFAVSMEIILHNVTTHAGYKTGQLLGGPIAPRLGEEISNLIMETLNPFNIRTRIANQLKVFLPIPILNTYLTKMIIQQIDQKLFMGQIEEFESALKAEFFEPIKQELCPALSQFSQEGVKLAAFGLGGYACEQVAVRAFSDINKSFSSSIIRFIYKSEESDIVDRLRKETEFFDNDKFLKELETFIRPHYIAYKSLQSQEGCVQKVCAVGYNIGVAIANTFYWGIHISYSVIQYGNLDRDFFHYLVGDGPVDLAIITMQVILSKSTESLEEMIGYKNYSSLSYFNGKDKIRIFEEKLQTTIDKCLSWNFFGHPTETFLKDIPSGERKKALLGLYEL